MESNGGGRKRDSQSSSFSGEAASPLEGIAFASPVCRLWKILSSTEDERKGAGGNLPVVMVVVVVDLFFGGEEKMMMQVP